MASPWPSWDPLGRSIRLDYAATVYPLGFELRVEANAPRVIEAARASWPGPDGRRGRTPLNLRVFVSPGAACAQPPTHRADGDRVTLFADRAHGATVDLRSGELAVWVSLGTVASAGRLRRWFLEGPVLETLCFQALTPIHCAAVVRDDRATLLCGRSGAGKSTLAAACVAAGWSLLGDDAAYVLRGTRRVLGRGGPLRLDSASLQILGRPESRREGAELGEAVSEVRADRSVEEADLGRVVVLDRSPAFQVPTLEAIQPAEALERLVAELPLNERAVTAAQIESLRSAAQVAGRLQFHDPHAAERLLRADPPPAAIEPG